MQRNYKTAQRGRPAWVSLCPLSITRIDYAKHFIGAELAASASSSTVVRRALELYQFHLEELASPIASKQDLDNERLALLRANRGDTRSVSAAQLAALPGNQPVPSLASLLAPPRAPSPFPTMTPRHYRHE